MQRGLAAAAGVQPLLLQQLALKPQLAFTPAGKIPFESAPEDDRQLPDLHLALYNDVVVLDQATKVGSTASQ